jgi:hypothetical protein
MPLPFACPHCGEMTLVDDEYAGHSGPCIGCGRTIVVPRFASPRPAGPPGAIPASAYPGMPQVSPRSRLLFLTLVGVGATVAVLALLAIIFQPVMAYSRANAHRRQCAANLRKIGVALLAYEQKYGSLPPAYVEDKAGTRLHSWRVLILPFLGPEESALYEEYDFRQSWDSPHNRLVADKIPAVFRCPADEPEYPENANETSYLVIVGKGTAFPGATTVCRKDINDDHRQTIYVVEANATKILWTEPSDLSDVMQGWQIGTELGGNHNRGANVLFSTGEVRFLREETDTQDLRAMSTINGNEPIAEY